MWTSPFLIGKALSLAKEKIIKKSAGLINGSHTKNAKKRTGLELRKEGSWTGGVEGGGDHGRGGRRGLCVLAGLGGRCGELKK